MELADKNFDVTLQPSRERTLINGCADAVYNRFVIEYKPSNSLRKEPNARPNQHAIAQVKQYLERLERHRRERLAGAVLDGNFFIFVRYRDNHWYIGDPLPVSAHSTETFLCYLLSLSTEKAVTPEDLVRDFGENSNTARAVVPALYRALDQTFDVFETSKVSILFRSGFHRQSNHLDREAGQVVMVGDDARRVVEAVCEQMDAKGLEGSPVFAELLAQLDLPDAAGQPLPLRPTRIKVEHKSVFGDYTSSETSHNTRNG